VLCVSQKYSLLQNATNKQQNVGDLYRTNVCALTILCHTCVEGLCPCTSALASAPCSACLERPLPLWAVESVHMTWQASSYHHHTHHP
jgi:hypothetical protein